MSRDYYDAVPPEVDVETKECPDCHGKGGHCGLCLGTGLVEMTAEDIQGEIDAREDDIVSRHVAKVRGGIEL